MLVSGFFHSPYAFEIHSFMLLHVLVVLLLSGTTERIYHNLFSILLLMDIWIICRFGHYAHMSFVLNICFHFSWINT